MTLTDFNDSKDIDERINLERNIKPLKSFTWKKKKKNEEDEEEKKELMKTCIIL